MSSPFVISRRVGLVACTLAVLLAAGIFASSYPRSLNHSTIRTPSVTWSEPRIEINLSPGQQSIRQLAFTSTENLSEVSLRIVPEISQFVSVSPSSIPIVNANGPQPVTLNFAIPAQTALGNYEGVIQVRSSNSTVPATLKILVRVVFQNFSDTTSGVSFQYPTLPRETNITKTVISDTETHFDISMKFPSGDTFYPVFGLTLYDNPTRQSLTEWFRSQIDINDIIYNSGAYQEQQLSTSIRALVRVGTIPDYGGGAVADAYGITPSGNKIVSIEQSPDSPLLPQDGYSQSDKQVLMRRVLGSTQIN